MIARPGDANKQSGVVLVIALLMLLVLTLIGLAATSSSRLELKMAGNVQDHQVAFQAAEAALIDCENLLTLVSLPTFTFSGASGYYKVDGSETTPAWKRTDWTNSDSHVYAGSTIDNVAQPPRCIIEQLPPVPPPGGSMASDTAAVHLMYRISSRGIGGSADTHAVLQTTFRR